MNETQLQDFARNAQALIDQGVVEDRLRHYLSAHLRYISRSSMVARCTSAGDRRACKICRT